MRQIEGSQPNALRRDLTKVCASFNSEIVRLDQQNVTILEKTRVVAALYSGILRVHPFADGVTARLSWHSRLHCGRWDSPLSNSLMTKT